MKLPDFSINPQLNSLRDRMGATYVEFSHVDWETLDLDSLLKKLQEGIEVSLEEITISSDGTFDYNGIKVLIYIKDQNYYAGRDNEYKFHICNCEKIDEFRRLGRLDRYVVSRNTNGQFEVNIYDRTNRRYIKQNHIIELKVCKYCLTKISYKGYTSYRSTPSVYDTFSLTEFFSIYKTSQFSYTPSRMSDEAALNEYTSDFPKISEQFRKSKAWTCERCSLSLEDDKKFLHVHHRNGLKWDNNFSNLECVCVGCHAESPGHERMKFIPDYLNFMLKYKNPWENLRKR
jgi:hypothetical protein